MPMILVSEPNISSHIGERSLDLVGAGELELARLLTWETTDQQQAVDRITQQMQQGVEKAQLWIWTALTIALALTLLVIGFFAQSP
jgi:hypothetical protein